MKPLHIALLIVGAALAGGLAVKMTEIQPVQPAPVASSPSVRVVAAPAPVLKTAPVIKPTVSEPARDVLPSKPTPIPRRVELAPRRVYVEPVHVEPIHVEPVVRKSKPVALAKVEPPPPPLLPPVRYEPPQVAPTPEPQAVPEPSPAPETPPPAPRRQAILPAGMTVAVRLNESLSSQRGIAGDTFQASLSEPMIVDGLVIAERGARARGRIIGTQRAGRVSGTSSLDLELTMVETSDGQKVEISTVPWTKRGDASYGGDAAKIGGGAVLGAVIGGIAGGGKGAAIGAGAGSILGAGAAAATRGKPVNIPSETVIRFRLASQVTITERQL
jgi:hypothetical protein